MCNITATKYAAVQAVQNVSGSISLGSFWFLYHNERKIYFVCLYRFSETMLTVFTIVFYTFVAFGIARFFTSTLYGNLEVVVLLLCDLSVAATTKRGFKLF